MKTYAESIIKYTNCKISEVKEVEEIMREDILHSTLDWLSKEQFKKVANEAYELYKILKNPELLKKYLN